MIAEVENVIFTMICKLIPGTKSHVTLTDVVWSILKE